MSFSFLDQKLKGQPSEETTYVFGEEGFLHKVSSSSSSSMNKLRFFKYSLLNEYQESPEV